MAPLLILITVSLGLLAAGRFGVRALRDPTTAVRGGLAAMFTVTGVAHFVGMRAEMIAMVPPALPAPAALVTLTGVLELLGVVGLLWSRRTAQWTALGLTFLLVAMFPANVHAALAHQSTAFEDRLVPRTLMQLVFLAATIGVAVRTRRTTLVA
ncbi:hypothetical protein D5S18_05415 [Nocardia panacis]|uniref:DoxX family membrane protein n=1 Tax=Nocardia panacis TaxID=2340916 RepID=A0A3A4KTI0_9NOCA|nr:DoxX family protein [Nocardia panacis]RJO78345.1 hypothetical protein D5S18_05415 [Nocardia panacis]